MTPFSGPDLDREYRGQGSLEECLRGSQHLDPYLGLLLLVSLYTGTRIAHLRLQADLHSFAKAFASYIRRET